MVAKPVLVCFIVCVYFAEVFCQVGSLCRPKERLLPCGCPKTCRDPVPDCKAVCKMGCFCEEGEVRNDDGICVKLADCPPLPSAYILETSEPRLHGGECPEDEEYRFCEPCMRTCDNPNPMCPAQCAKGCFCKGDLLRDKDGRCVKFENCSNFIDYIKEREKNYVEPILYRFSCGKNQVYKECEKCTRSCGEPAPVCGKCRTGCFCKEGLVKGPDGKCVQLDQCPQAAEILFGEAQSSIEDCSSGEEYLSCGWCEPTCQQPAPACPAACTRGCLCRPPLLRHSSGLCVTKERCGPSKCEDPNEEFGCRYGCEPRCGSMNSSRSCAVLGRRCELKCHCRRGFLRADWGRCVTEQQCANNTTDYSKLLNSSAIVVV